MIKCEVLLSDERLYVKHQAKVKGGLASTFRPNEFVTMRTRILPIVLLWSAATFPKVKSQFLPLHGNGTGNRPSSVSITKQFLDRALAATVDKHKLFVVIEATVTKSTEGEEDFEQILDYSLPVPAAVYRNATMKEFSAAVNSGRGADVMVSPRLFVLAVGSDFDPDDLLTAHFTVEDSRQPVTSLLFVYNSAMNSTEVDNFFGHHAFSNIHRVALATIAKPEDPDITGYSYNIKKKCKFCNKGFPGWRHDNTWNASHGFEKTFNMIFAEERDLNKRRIVMITDDFPPYTSFKAGPNGTQQVLSEENLCSQLFLTLASKMNYNVTVRRPADGQWGNELPNGSWNGIVGEVSRKLGDVSCLLSRTPSRLKALDFSALFAIEPLTLIVSAGAKPPGFIILFIPFKLEVWVLILVTLIVIAAIAFTCGKFGFFDALAILLQQSSLVRPIYDLSTRLFMVAWGIGAILLATYYSALFLAFQAVPPGPVDVSNMGTMVADAAYRCGMEASMGSPYSFVEISAKASPVFGEFFRRLELIPKDEDSIEYFRQGKFGYVCSVACSRKLVKGAATSYPDERVLAVTSERFYARPMGLGFPKGSPLREAFDEYLADLAAGGFLYYWYEKYSSSTFTKKDEQVRELKLDDLQGHFFVWGIGCFVACLSLAAEIAWTRFDVRSKLKMARSKNTISKFSMD